MYKEEEREIEGGVEESKRGEGGFTNIGTEIIQLCNCNKKRKKLVCLILALTDVSPCSV